MADISKITTPEGTTYNIKDAVARSAIENLPKKLYSSVAELNLTSGTATISDVWTALPTNTSIRFPRSEVSDYPVNAAGYIEIIKVGPNGDLGSIIFYGGTYGTHNYRMYLTNAGIPDGTWRLDPDLGFVFVDVI